MTNRTTDQDVIEHRLLELVYTTDAKITAPVLAYYAPCSIEDAERVLENLAAHERITMEITDDGTVVYHVRDRQKLPRVEHETTRALTVAELQMPLALRGNRQASPGVAAFLSLVLPGAGQVYTGGVLSGILWFLLVSAGYTLLIPGLFLHLLCIASAATSAHRLNSDLARLRLQH